MIAVYILSAVDLFGIAYIIHLLAKRKQEAEFKRKMRMLMYKEDGWYVE